VHAAGDQRNCSLKSCGTRVLEGRWLPLNFLVIQNERPSDD
jgi:hypothetical protein